MEFGKNKKIVDFGVKIGEFKSGRLNKITDVKGVKVGHFTKIDGNYKSGITAILPCEDIYFNPLISNVKVINGFGKTTGIMQIEELGEIESPILLTNTLSVGNVSSGLVDYMVNDLKKKDYNLKTFNPVIAECNDSNHNEIWLNKLEKNDVFEAFNDLKENFLEGSIGAGTSMTCYSLKGGIGSSSRIFKILDKEYTVGTLVLSNHGRLEDFKINDNFIGKKILNELDNNSQIQAKKELDKGSIIILMATDMPLSSRQIKRVLNRANVGLINTGSHLGHGSGDICIGFSTAYKLNRKEYLLNKNENCLLNEFSFYNDALLDNVFRAFAESVEESILNSLLNATTILNTKGEYTKTLSDFIKFL